MEGKDLLRDGLKEGFPTVTEREREEMLQKLIDFGGTPYIIMVNNKTIQVGVFTNGSKKYFFQA